VTRAVIFAAIGLSLAAWLEVDGVWQFTGPGPLSEPWRLFTSALLHGGMLHLVFNVLWIYELGTALELTLGQKKTAVLFAILTAASSLAQQLIDDQGIGLSGLVYGLFGTLWVAKKRGLPVGRLLSEPITRLFVAWFFIAILLDYFGWMRIGNVAHAAGAIAGCLAGLFMPPGATPGWPPPPNAPNQPRRSTGP
jgi:GlpG protein